MGRPWVQLEVMVEDDGFLDCFGDELDADLDVEFAPACF